MRETVPFESHEQIDIMTPRVETSQCNEEWGEVLGEGFALLNGYIQEGQERMVKGVMASVLEDAYYSYRQRGLGAVDFGESLRDFLKDVEIPTSIDRLYGKNELIGKRQPSFEESIKATLERYYFMEQLESTFGEKIDGIIVGGSMSYGPFFNVRSGQDNSDVDAIMIMSDNFFEEEWIGVVNSEILTDEDKTLFLDRKDIFAEMHQKGKADIFSQRFVAKDGDFNMSAHIMSRQVYEETFGEGLKDSMLDGRDKIVALKDYKPHRFERAKCDHQGFDGRKVDFFMDRQEEVDCGFVATIPAYIMDDGQYFPGLYQCLLLPSTLVAFDKSGYVSETAAAFVQLVKDRVETERQINPHSTLLNAYPRKPILAPGRYEGVTVGY